jgi:hypothetical protein
VAIWTRIPSVLALGVALGLLLGLPPSARAVTQLQEFGDLTGSISLCYPCEVGQILGGSLEFVFDADSPPYPATLTYFVADVAHTVEGPFLGQLTPAGPNDFEGHFENSSITEDATLNYTAPNAISVEIRGRNRSGFTFVEQISGVLAPEPNTLLLLGGGMAGFVMLGRSKRTRPRATVRRTPQPASASSARSRPLRPRAILRGWRVP